MTRARGTVRDARAVGRWRNKTRARATARARETTTEGVGVSEKRDAEGVDCERRGFRASERLTERAARAAPTQVKWFNATKGFGFIVPDDGSEEIFVHQTAIETVGFRSLWEGEEVDYKIDTSDVKPKAVGVTGPGGAKVKGAPRRRHRNRAAKRTQNDVADANETKGEAEKSEKSENSSKVDVG